MLALMDAQYPHRELVCVTSEGLPVALRCYLKEHTADDLQVMGKTAVNAAALAACAPFTKDYPIPEQGTMYYLCEDGMRKAPVADMILLKL